jgi:hypothetical protein
MSSTQITLTKFEAARRQLVTAIRLFFDDADSVSVFALAHASWEILDALCKYRNKRRIRSVMARADGVTEGDIKLAMSYGRNFFKHADKDPSAKLDDFSDDRNDVVLMAAIMDFNMLAQSEPKPMEIQIFEIWYFAAHRGKTPKNLSQDIVKAGKQLFPGIANLERSGRKSAGREALLRSLQDQELMSHPLTDRSPVSALL